MKRQQHTSSPCIHWVGVDVAKKTFDAALVFHGQKWPATDLETVPVHTFARTATGVGEFLDWLDAQAQGSEVRAVMEATGNYSTELAVWMMQRRPCLAPAIAPPHQTAAFIKSMGLRNKTDKIEARALGFYGMERQPVAYQPLSKEEASLRDLVRYRRFLVEEQTAYKNRTQEPFSEPLVLQMEKKRMAQLAKDIKRVEKEMRQLVDGHEELKRDIELMSSIYGVSFIISTIIRAELGDLRRFQKARQLSAYAGISPSYRRSGTSIHGRPHMNKQGNPHVRQALFLAAMTVIRGDNELSAEYARLLENKHSKMSALGAIMRKVLVLMRAILISGTPYDSWWKTLSNCA